MLPDDFDPAQLRAFVARDWGALAERDRAARASQPLDVKMRIAAELYEAGRRTVPGWPRDADRLADLAHHVTVRSLLRRAADARP